MFPYCDKQKLVGLWYITFYSKYILILVQFEYNITEVFLPYFSWSILEPLHVLNETKAQWPGPDLYTLPFMSYRNNASSLVDNRTGRVKQKLEFRSYGRNLPKNSNGTVVRTVQVTGTPCSENCTVIHVRGKNDFCLCVESLHNLGLQSLTLKLIYLIQFVQLPVTD